MLQFDAIINETSDAIYRTVNTHVEAHLIYLPPLTHLMGTGVVFGAGISKPG